MTEHNPASEPQSASADQQAQSSPVSRALTWLIRLVLVVVIGAFLGAGLYFGVPALLQAAVEPVEENKARIEQLEEELERRERERGRERTEISDELAELQGRVTGLIERVGEIEARGDSVDEDLGALEERIEEVDALAVELGSLERDLEELQGDFSELGNAQSDSQEELDQLTQRVRRLRVLHLITQARRSVAAEEFVQAAGWIERAQAEILAAEAQDGSDDTLEQVLERLELALEALESERFEAADRDLQTAWETLITEPAVSPTLTPGTTPTEESEGADS